MEDMQEAPIVPEAPAPAGNDVEEHKVVAAIGYIFILCFIPLLLAKESPYAQFHAKQALALFIIDVGVMIFNTVFGWFPIIGWFLALGLTLAIFVLSIIGFLKAFQGEKWEMPLVSQLAKALKF
ncbi:MAG: DUF4870 domain-containing protein [Patescibacteria group bacterium]|jgi:uncharacterized membrane protein